MSFKTTTVIPATTYNHQAVIAYGYIYLIGGISGGSEVTTVRSAPISSDGSIGTWGTTTVLPEARSMHQAFFVTRESDQKSYIFVIGGELGGTRKSTVWYAQVTGSGTLGSWSVAGAFPAVVARHRVVVRDQWIYVIGGVDSGGTAVSTVRRATVAEAISGTWTAVSSLPAAREGGHCVIDGNVIYYCGGIDSGASFVATSYSGLIAPGTGAVTWSTLSSSPLPNSFAYGSALAHEGNVYVFGGYAVSYLTACYSAPALSDGTLGDWTSLSALPAARSQAAVAKIGQTMVLSGGATTGGTELDSNLFDWVPNFSNLIDKTTPDGVGLVHKLHVYFDGTTQYRYCDKWFDDANDHDPRILSIGPVLYGFGSDHSPVSADLQVVLNNSDESADWWADRVTAKDAKKAFLRLYVGGYESSQSSPVIYWKQLGEFVVSTNVERDNRTIKFGISDNFQGKFGHQVTTPTVRDWVDNDTSGPFYRGGSSFNFDFDVNAFGDLTIPVVFGNEEVRAIRIGSYVKTSGQTATRNKHIVYLIGCFVSGSVADAEISRVYSFTAGNPPVQLGSSIPGAQGAVWTKTAGTSFSKYGKTWKVIYLTLDITQYTISIGQKGYQTPANQPIEPTEISVVMNKASVTPEDLITDIVSLYLPVATQSALDMDSLDRLERALHSDGNSYIAGVLNSGVTIREVLSKICDSFDMDCYLTGSGKLGVSGRVTDATYASSELDNIPELSETDLWDVVERYPSKGQRWAPVNRLMYVDLKPPPLFQERRLTFAPSEHWSRIASGPYDNASSEIGTGTIEALDISVAWRPASFSGTNPWTYRSIESTMRPTLHFKTHLGASRLKPGDYFRASWSRNKGTSDPYSSDVFKVDEITVDTREGYCEIVAAYFGDEITPFLLDDVLLFERYTPSTGGNVTVTDASPVVTFSAGNLVAAGVVAGDHLVLMDANEATTVFQRNRGLKIASVDSATQVTVSDADLDFDAPGGTSVSTWRIYRSHLTGQTASLPNYPEGHTIYGKACDSSNQYSDASDAHKLLDG